MEFSRGTYRYCNTVGVECIYDQTVLTAPLPDGHGEFLDLLHYASCGVGQQSCCAEWRLDDSALRRVRIGQATRQFHIR